MIVKQIRYYGEADDPRHDLNTKNFDPENLLNEGVLYCDEIRIKTHPETLMKINDASVLVGKNGRYEIPFKEKTKITTASIENMAIIRDNLDSDASFIMTFILNQEESITADTEYELWLRYHKGLFEEEIYDNHDDGDEFLKNVSQNARCGTAICGAAICGNLAYVDYAEADISSIGAKSA